MKTTEFKDSELGPIPKEWEVKRLGEIGSPLMCKRVLKEQTKTEGDIPFYKIGTFGQRPDAFIDRKLYEELRAAFSYPRKGDLLISAAGTIGRVVRFDGKDAYFQDSNIIWLNHDESVVLNDYLYWCYKTAKWAPENGGTVSRLYNAIFNAQPILLPPLAEQRRIAEVLGKTDEYIEALKKLIEKRKNVKRGAMQELLTGKRRLPGFEGEWVEKRLGEVVKIGNGKDYKHLGSGDIPVYGTGGLMTRVNDFLHDGPTVCFGRKGTIDEPQYHEGKIWTVDTLFYTYDFTDVDAKWLFYRSQLIDWMSYNAASGVPSLTANTIESIKVLMPIFPKQKAIAKVLSEMDEGIEALEKKLKKVEAIKEGMMQDLLTGKVRLKEDWT